MSLSERVEAQRRLLGAHQYEPIAADLIRYRSEGVDDEVGSVVRATVADGPEGAELFRRAASGDDLNTLRLYAARRITAARRLSSAGPLYEAIDAFGLLAQESDVPWETWVKGALFTAREVGGDGTSLHQRFSDLHPALDERFAVALESMERVEDLGQCRLVETSTTYGGGLFETLVILSARLSRNPASAWGTGWFGTFGAPLQADNYVTYDPTTNLARLTAGFADQLDATRRVSTGPLGHDQLADIQFGQARSGSYLPVRGCLSFVVSDDRDAAMTVFVAEVPERDDDDDDDTLDATSFAASLAEAASQLEGQVAMSDGARLVLLSAQPSFTDEDHELDVAEFVDLARSALADPALR